MLIKNIRSSRLSINIAITLLEPRLAQISTYKLNTNAGVADSSIVNKKEFKQIRAVWRRPWTRQSARIQLCLSNLEFDDVGTQNSPKHGTWLPQKSVYFLCNLRSSHTTFLMDIHIANSSADRSAKPQKALVCSSLSHSMGTFLVGHDLRYRRVMQ